MHRESNYLRPRQDMFQKAIWKHAKIKKPLASNIKLCGGTGFEPANTCVTGPSTQLLDLASKPLLTNIAYRSAHSAYSSSKPDSSASFESRLPARRPCHYLPGARRIADTLNFRQVDGALQGSTSRKVLLIKKLKNAAIKKCVRRSEQMRETSAFSLRHAFAMALYHFTALRHHEAASKISFAFSLSCETALLSSCNCLHSCS